MEDRMAHTPSDLDAMGRDKRRPVVGHVDGPTRARIAIRFVILLAIVIVLLVGAKIAIDRLDQPPDSFDATAPWADPDAQQRPPRPIQ